MFTNLRVRAIVLGILAQYAKGGAEAVNEEKKNRGARTVGMVMLLTLLGKALGLLRDMLMGRAFGTGMAANAFLTASRIPRNFFDAIFAAAISASFIPVFNEYLEKKGRDEAFRLASAFITVTALATAAMSAVGMAFSGELTALLADGFDGETAALCAFLLRLLFPTVLFTGVAFSLVGILQSLGEFNIPALLSTVSNGVILFYYVFFCERFGVTGLAAAFLLGWAAQVCIQLPALHRAGFRYRPALRHEGLRKVFTLMLPVMASTWVQPLNLTVATKYASHLNGGSAASALEYANTLYTIVAGVFVLSIANVIFPEMSRLSARREDAALDEQLRGTLSTMLFFLVPMSAGLAVMAKPIVRLLYEWGAWTEESTALTAGALSLAALGMLGYGLQMILSRAYYAAQQGKMPLLSGIASVAANLALCALLAPRMGVRGLALAGAVSALVPALVLLAALLRSGHAVMDRASLTDFGKMLACAAAMAGGVLTVRRLTAGLGGDGVAGRVLAAALPTAAGAVIYFALALLLGAGVMRPLQEKLREKAGGNMIENSLLLSGLRALCARVRKAWYGGVLYRAWLWLAVRCARLLDGSLIVSFFRADWDEKLHLTPRLLPRVQAYFGGNAAFAVKCRQSVVLGLLDERLCFAVLCLAAFALSFAPTLVSLLLTLAAFALYALNVLLGRIRAERIGLVGVLGALFALCYALSTVFGKAFPDSMEEMLMFLGLMTAVPVAARVLRGERRRDIFLTVLLFSGVLASLYGIYQYIVGVPIDPAWVDSKSFETLTTRAYSTFGNPNVMGEYLIVVCSLSVGMFWKERRRFLKFCYFCATGVLGLGLLATGSRGSMLGLAVSAAVFALFAEHRLLPFGIAAAAAMPFVLPASIQARFLGALMGTDSSTKYRMSIYGACFNMIRDYWLTGIGVGAFALVYPRYVYAASNSYHSHNLFLQVLLELGVVGFTVFLLLLFTWAQRLYRAIARDKTRGRFLTGVVLSGMTGLLVQGMTDHLWFNYRIVLLFWLVIGLGLACARGEERT